ncbi:very short patch repair endonuclease [Thioalkalivibrio sp. HK1]|uniref:very short patch repair endonuclease n=1 Tax=Thioalkalivibrio sp. HK1 TaxID=1469245 RepID=UPI0004BA07A2|nr:very short patch repair endonuclease [Thioalkalivibrio sp. HK1]
MTDTVDLKTRSRIMASVGGKNSKAERTLRRFLHAKGFRYILHDRRLPGTPDIVFPRYRAICFVHGCFWHRHPDCKHASTPSTRREFWDAKFRQNVERDRRNRYILLEMGWRVSVVWECALGKGKKNDAHARRIARALGDWLQGSKTEFDSGSNFDSFEERASDKPTPCKEKEKPEE